MGRNKMKIEDYAINMIDNLPIGEAIKVVSYYDSRPLTDETLKELGFVKDDYKHETEDGWNFWELSLEAEPDPCHYYMKLVTDLSNNKERWCIIQLGKGQCYFTQPKLKTVGSVRMLIEALKGDG
jgi:hypothetical protein